MGKTRRPRISPEDYRLRDELKPGERYRVPFYSKSHVMGGDGETARCGYPLVVDQDWWDKWQKWLAKYYDADPGELYWAIERRKEANWCKKCNGRDMSLEPEQTLMVRAQYAPVPEADLTPAQRLERRRLASAAQRVARELDATLVTGE